MQDEVPHDNIDSQNEIQDNDPLLAPSQDNAFKNAKSTLSETIGMDRPDNKLEKRPSRDALESPEIVADISVQKPPTSSAGGELSREYTSQDVVSGKSVSLPLDGVSSHQVKKEMEEYVKEGEVYADEVDESLNAREAESLNARESINGQGEDSDL